MINLSGGPMHLNRVVVQQPRFGTFRDKRSMEGTGVGVKAYFSPSPALDGKPFFVASIRLKDLPAPLRRELSAEERRSGKADFVILPGTEPFAQVETSISSVITRVGVENFEKRGRAIDFGGLGFGLTPTDIMMTMEARGGKWGVLEARPYGRMLTHPASAERNYGQAIFEGQKAVRGKDGRVFLFRPIENARRLARGAARLDLTPVPEDVYIRAEQEVVRQNLLWVPPVASGGSLYIRPTLSGTGGVMGVHSDPVHTFNVICTAVGPYYPQGFSSISLYATSEYHRSAPGVTGSIKASGNYAGTMIVAKEAAAQGCTQVIYLNLDADPLMEEIGTSNVFFFNGKKLMTPKLDSGTILPGITRLSLIDLARALGYEVEEADIPLSHVCQLASEGRPDIELFGSGTAVVVSPVGKVKWPEGGYSEVTIGNGKPGPVTQELYHWLTLIQRGEVPDDAPAEIRRLQDEWVHEVSLS